MRFSIRQNELLDYHGKVYPAVGGSSSNQRVSYLFTDTRLGYTTQTGPATNKRSDYLSGRSRFCAYR
jgi:hypothetical protein